MYTNEYRIFTYRQDQWISKSPLSTTYIYAAALDLECCDGVISSKKPAAKKPAAQKPAAKKPTAKKPAAKKLAAKKPAAKKWAWLSENVAEAIKHSICFYGKRSLLD